jgi:hypothetical protein
MQPFDQLLPSLFFLAGIGILVLCLKAFGQNHRQSELKPDAEDGKRSLPTPGESESTQIDHLNRDVTAYTISTCALPIILCAAVILPVSVGGAEFDLAAIAAAAAMAAAAYSYSLIRLIQLVRKRRETRLRWEGKTAVGRALEALAGEGYLVFHDFPAESFTIDHIVLGKNGVFSVMTQAHVRPGNSKRVEDATVTYNGHTLFFRGRADDKTIVHAQHQADWLSEWMGRQADEEVAVRAVVAVPGWFVQRTTPEGIPVVNPRQIPSLFKYVIPRALEEEQLLKIAWRLEQTCSRRTDP